MVGITKLLNYLIHPDKLSLLYKFQNLELSRFYNPVDYHIVYHSVPLRFTIGKIGRLPPPAPKIISLCRHLIETIRRQAGLAPIYTPSSSAYIV